MSWPAWVGDLVRVLAVGSSNSWFGLVCLPTAAHPSLTWLLSSWLACALEFFWSWLLGSTFWCCSPPCLASFPPHLPPLSPVHPTGYLPTCMNATGILISAIRTAVSSLRAIASTLRLPSADTRLLPNLHLFPLAFHSFRGLGFGRVTTFFFFRWFPISGSLSPATTTWLSLSPLLLLLAISFVFLSGLRRRKGRVGFRGRGRRDIGLRPHLRASSTNPGQRQSWQTCQRSTSSSRHRAWLALSGCLLLLNISRSFLASPRAVKVSSRFPPPWQRPGCIASQLELVFLNQRNNERSGGCPFTLRDVKTLDRGPAPPYVINLPTQGDRGWHHHSCSRSSLHPHPLSPE